MAPKTLTIKQLFNLAICAFGIQFASSLVMANISSVFKFCGASGGSLSYLWLAAPMSGLIIQPLIGQLSDDTLTRYGKRRPYVLVWGLITFLCLILMPLASSLGRVAILFWGIGCGINGMTEALRALIGDITPNQQKTQAFSWQTVFAGMGAVLAAVTPFLLFKFAPTFCKNILNFNLVPCYMQISFILSGVVVLVCSLWMLHKIKERNVLHISVLKKSHQANKKNIIKKIKNTVLQLFFNIIKLPLVIRQFMSVQVFTWVGLFSMWLYFALAIAQHRYGLPIGADVTQNSQYADILAKSTIKTDIYFGIYQLFSVVYAMWLPSLIKKFSPKLIHAISLCVGAIGLLMVVRGGAEWRIIAGMIAIGVMWGSIMTMPYAIISAGLPRSKMGVYLGVFNITITAPQIVTSLLLGFVYTFIFREHAIYCILLAGVSIFVAGVLLFHQSRKEDADKNLKISNAAYSAA